MSGSELLYHVTHTKHIPRIQKHGLLPMQTSNWVKAGDKERYGKGEVYTFTHKDDAHQWAGRMDWAHHQKLGSGNISIVTMRKPEGHKFSVDKNDPLSQAGQKGKWLKTDAAIHPKHIVGVEKYAPKKMGESVESDLNSQWIYSQGIVTKKKQEKKMAKEEKDRIGKPTASAAEIAKKHDIPLAQVHHQIAKGVKVEREHTNSDVEAAEIARDHLDEFPDYYDRLHKMEKQAKKDMKEGAVLEATYHARVIAHPAVADVDHGGPGDYFVNLKKGWHLGDGSRSFGNESPRHAWKMLKHATQKDYKKWVSEDVANSVGGGNIAGMPTADTPDTSVARPLGGMQRRKKFAGKTVFVVDPTTFHKAYLGKRKYEHYEKYLEGCDIAEEIRQYGRTYWDEPIIIQNEQTGAMVYLKYGSK
jgi:hypothetical protein